jgi:hypothetical protein
MLESRVDQRFNADQCIIKLDEWTKDIKRNLKEEFDKKKKPYPKGLMPLSTNEVIKAALKNLISFKTQSIAKVSIYNFFAKELLTNQERLVIT